ncbi:VOC family protein [Nocardiopsis coralliicola]
MITTDMLAGSPCWLDLGAPDVPAAAAFYTAVFGWDTFDPMGGGEYLLFQKDGRVAAAVGGLDEGARSAWTVYYAVDDTDAVAAAVAGSGGRVRTEPGDIPGVGRFAQLSDPKGGQFAVIHSADNSAFGAVDEPDTFGWAELWTPDAGGAKAFYSSVLGWEYTDMPMPAEGGGTYTLIRPGGTGDDRNQGGLMQVGADELAPSGGAADWHPVFYTADCDAAVDRVRGAGGTVYMGPDDAPGVGRIAACSDPAHAAFVLLTPSPN